MGHMLSRPRPPVAAGACIDLMMMYQSRLMYRRKMLRGSGG